MRASCFIGGKINVSAVMFNNHGCTVSAESNTKFFATGFEFAKKIAS